MDQKFTFVFNTDETNLMLSALGNMPYAQVAKLIGNIQTQAEEQLKKPETE
jgi:hypothetical protein